MSAKFTINMQQELERNMRRVMRLLNWTDTRNEYNNYMIGSGTRFLHMRLQNDVHAIMLLSGSAEYWGWFKNQWAIRDMCFLDDEAILEAEYSVRERRNIYEMTHVLALTAEPSTKEGEVLEHSYAEMIGRVFDAAKRRGDV